MASGEERPVQVQFQEEKRISALILVDFEMQLNRFQVSFLKLKPKQCTSNDNMLPFQKSTSQVSTQIINMCAKSDSRAQTEFHVRNRKKFHRINHKLFRLYYRTPFWDRVPFHFTCHK